MWVFLLSMAMAILGARKAPRAVGFEAMIWQGVCLDVAVEVPVGSVRLRTVRAFSRPLDAVSGGSGGYEAGRLAWYRDTRSILAFAASAFFVGRMIVNECVGIVVPVIGRGLGCISIFELRLVWTSTKNATIIILSSRRNRRIEATLIGTRKRARRMPNITRIDPPRRYVAERCSSR